MNMKTSTVTGFLFFPVLRRGSVMEQIEQIMNRFYSSPSCDGDQTPMTEKEIAYVSILPRLATGINLS